jgi:phosphoglycolate phosphatase-like HAD superfamily hydrolase
MENWTKEHILQDILKTNALKGDELLVVGDGPVEIESGKTLGAVTLGVATDERRRRGLDRRKRQRLLAAGADLIVTSFLHHKALIRLLVSGKAL